VKSYKTFPVPMSPVAWIIVDRTSLTVLVDRNLVWLSKSLPCVMHSRHTGSALSPTIIEIILQMVRERFLAALGH
jgi:hypothetical protein